MGYIVDGVELETDGQGFLLEANFSEEVVRVIAAAEGVEPTDHDAVAERDDEDGREHHDRHRLRRDEQRIHGPPQVSEQV